MKRLTKLDIWQTGWIAFLWIIHNRTDSLLFRLVPSAENYTLHMIGAVAAVALHKAVWFLGLWLICIALRRREMRLKTIGIAFALALGLGCVSYYVRTPLFLFWGATLLVFRNAAPRYPPMKRKTIILFAAIILASFAYDLFATHMELRYFENRYILQPFAIPRACPPRAGRWPGRNGCTPISRKTSKTGMESLILYGVRHHNRKA